MFEFPFTTCENNTNGIVAQPFSTFVNVISTLILLGFFIAAETMSVKVLLGSFVLFEAWHSFSHIKHIPGNIQTDVVHVLGYAIAFSTLFTISHLSQRSVSNFLSFAIFVAVIFDIYIYFHVKGIWTVISALLIFAIIVFGNYPNLPPFFKSSAPFLII
jgi:hypothetical protein